MFASSSAVFESVTLIVEGRAEVNSPTSEVFAKHISGLDQIHSSGLLKPDTQLQATEPRNCQLANN
jgi:hypothetical protein